MPKPKQDAARPTRARKVIERRPRSQGWHTTDEEEIERRRQRAAGEPLTVEALEPEHPVFGAFRVASESGNAYEVEIRSLSEPENSCDCPDHQVNGLGTCKHVEAVLARVGRSRKAREGNRRIEVFLRRAGEPPEVRVQWPAGAGREALSIPTPKPSSSRNGSGCSSWCASWPRRWGSASPGTPARCRRTGDARTSGGSSPIPAAGCSSPPTPAAWG